MKIFSNSEPVSTSASANGIKRVKRSTISEKPEISEMEIRQKLAANVEASNTAKQQTFMKNSQQFGAGFMNEDMPRPVIAKTPEHAEAEVEKDIMLKSDIHLNDPKAPETQEKLKTVLSSGAFNFNAREREALDKILNGN